MAGRSEASPGNDIDQSDDNNPPPSSVDLVIKGTTDIAIGTAQDLVDADDAQSLKKFGSVVNGINGYGDAMTDGSISGREAIKIGSGLTSLSGNLVNAAVEIMDQVRDGYVIGSAGELPARSSVG